MNRLFTFGCSFTQYNWITWADIIGKLFEHHGNNGINGAGNFYIFNSFIHNLVHNNINADDTVMIMWTNVTREDRFLRGIWQTPGNLLTQTFYNKNFIENYFDLRGCYERDIPLIHATRLLLDKIGCKYVMMSMVDINNSDQYSYQDELNDMHISNLFNKFHSTLSLIRPSAHKVIFNYDYKTRPLPNFRKRPDLHPLPLEHLEYVEKVLPEYSISQEIKDYVYLKHQEVLVALKKCYDDV